MHTIPKAPIVGALYSPEYLWQQTDETEWIAGWILTL
jgi:hypothetical protein